MTRLVALALAAALALLVPATPVGAAGAAGAARRPPLLKCGSPKRVPVAVKKTAKVGDYFITPNLRVRPEACVTWNWSAANSDSHDVALRSGPKGVRRFHSKLASTEYSFKAYLKTRGTYRIYCTLHPVSMRQTITVR